uniref:Uncharacterized protein n=1 Tax=Sphaerodactylus townsendi TaxID=933632 RepID=A0ACB8EZD9_9SAUR
MHLGLLFFFLPLFMFPSAEDPEATSDSYWSGTAPFCFGSCRGKHKEVKRSPCGDGSCCWFGSKAFCRGKSGFSCGGSGLASGSGKPKSKCDFIGAN